MARLLGEAYIAILPETDQFGPQARAQIDRQTAAIRPEVNVGANLNKADVAKIGTQLKAISKANPVNVGVNLDKASAARMASQLKAYLRANTVDVVTKLDMASLGRMQTTLKAFLTDKDMEVGVQLNPAQLARIQGTFDAFVKEMNDEKISPNWNILPALGKMQMLKTANASLGQFIQEQNARNNVNLNIMPALAKIVALKAAESTLDTTKTGTIDLANGTGLATATQGVNSFMRALMNLSGAEADNTDTVNRMGRSYGVWGAAISALQVHIPLFGGALTALHFPNVIAQASGWHILAEAVIETAAVWGPATIAMAVFAAAAEQDARAIVTQWKNVQTVMSATSTPMDGLTTGLSKLSQALKPQIWDAFGAGLVAIESSSGKLTAPLQSIAHLFDVLGAHIDELTQQGGGAFSKFIQGGSNDIHELGEAFGNVGKILTVFFESVPGYATILLHLGTDILGATADVLQFLQPLIKIGLAVHGAIFYLGLASTLFLTFGRNALSAGATVAATGAKVDASGSKIANLGTGLGNLVGGFVNSGKSAVNWGKDLFTAGGQIGDVTGKSRLAGVGIKLLGDAGAVLADVPIAGWAIAAAAAIGVGLYFALRSTESAAQKLSDQLTTMIQNANPNTLFATTTKAIETNGKAIETLVTGYQKLAKAETTAAAVGPYTPKAGGAVGPYGSGKNKAPGANTQPVYQPFPAAEAQQYIDNFNKIAAAATPVARNELAVAKATGSMGNAIQIASAIGIKWSDINKATPGQLRTIVQEMDNYQKAVTFMSNSSGQAASNIAALSVAASSQVNNVTKLNSAWSTFLTMIGGGETSFISLEQGLQQYNKDLKAAGASMTGLSPASLTLRSDFQQVDTAAQSQVSALTTFIGATGGATQAQKTLANQGIKAVIAQMIPLAGANKSAQAEIVGLAQRANGSLTTWQAVTKWVGKGGAAGAAQTLQRVNGTLASSIQNVTQVANALTGAMQATAVAAQDKLVFALDGGATKMAAFGHALASANGQLTIATEKTGVQYYDALVKSGVGAETARQMVLQMSQSLGMSSANLNILNADLIANQAALNRNSAAAHNLTGDIKLNAASFDQLAAKTGLTSRQVQNLWAIIQQQDLAMVAGKAASAKSAFMDFATNGLHLSTAKAQELWNALHQQGLDVLATKANTTKAHFVDLAMNGLHLTSAQANDLWAALRMQYLDTLVQKGDAAKSSFINLAEKGFNYTAAQANTLWNTLRNQFLDTLSQKAGETEGAFIKTAHQFGLTTAAAQTLWSQLKTLAGGSPYDVAVQELLSGSGSISAKISAASIVLGGGGGVLTPKGANPKTNPSIGASQDIHKAAGGFVRIGGNHSNGDSVPIMAKPNELIIPAEHAPNVAQHMAGQGHKLPGYSQGGFIANAGTVAQNAVSATNGVISDVETFAKLASAAFNGDVQSQFQSAQASANEAAFGGASGGEIANATSAMKYLAANLFSGNLRAAAGAVASIFGESSWNPESVGTGGFGLIGWTGNTLGLPAGYHGPTGNATHDFDVQLEGIIGFVKASGDLGVISEMISAANANAPIATLAEMWGKGVERYGIDDVHSSGVQSAQAILNSLKAGKTATASSVQAQNQVAAKTNQVKPFSAGGTISEPVYGFGANSGIPYSFAENGPEMISPASQGGGGDNFMQPMTQSQGQQIIQLLQQGNTIVAQQPAAMAKIQKNGLSSGMRRGAFNTGG